MAPIPDSGNSNEWDPVTMRVIGMRFAIGILGILLAAVVFLACYQVWKNYLKPKLEAKRRAADREKYEGRSPIPEVLEGKEPARPEPAHVVGYEYKKPEVGIAF
ncbi:hypothetical protein N7535_001604 [Penicillium sp. DV-2018c]|nr:hypothetical protein N7461_005152 [Penicillium sp. DV-2018c]KAJ5582984.1 hypothetical protein N7535_001604 [Penicillium sp. DV-2018c]